MGSYNSDSHNVQRIVNADGFVRNEGDMQVAVKPYQIPYRVLLPKKGEAQNLLVPVCFSASHVAYSTLRMEPQYMILGQAAGVAAAMAIRGNGRAGHRYRGTDAHAGGAGSDSGVRAFAATGSGRPVPPLALGNHQVVVTGCALRSALFFGVQLEVDRRLFPRIERTQRLGAARGALRVGL